jgi:hypothetical protein
MGLLHNLSAKDGTSSDTRVFTKSIPDIIKKTISIDAPPYSNLGYCK